MEPHFKQALEKEGGKPSEKKKKDIRKHRE